MRLTRARGGWIAHIAGRMDGFLPDDCQHKVQPPCEECADAILFAIRAERYGAYPVERPLNWIDLTPDLPEIERRAAAIRECNKDYGTGIFLAKGNGDILGKKGECCYARHFGLPWEDDFNPAGDGGEDFAGVDVKATTERPPVLRVLVNKRSKHRASQYALVTVRGNSAAVYGIVPWHQVQSSPQVQKRIRGMGLGPLSYVVRAEQIPPL